MNAHGDPTIRHAVRSAFEGLSPERREALYLVRIQRRSLEDAARTMNLSREAVATLVALALHDLQEGLRPLLDGDPLP